MQFHIITVSLMVLPWLVICQIPFSNLNQYSASVVGDLSQQPNVSISNQYQQPINTQISTSSPSSTERYVVGNLSQSFTFQVAPPSIKVIYLSLNGHSLYITSVGFSNKSKFNYDEKTNKLTILSLDSTTVGYYSAVDGNWKTFTTILSAINNFTITVHSRSNSMIAGLHAEQQQKIAESTSSKEDFEAQQTNQNSEPSPVTGSTTSGYNQVDFHHQNGRRILTPPPAQKMVLHQPQAIHHHDEAPPSYHQIANKSSPAHAYAYQEPTEV